MADAGLTAGLLQGLQSGLDSYDRVRKDKRDEKKQNAMLAAQGYEIDDDGNIKPGAGLLEKQALEREVLRKKAGDDELDKRLREAQIDKIGAETGYLRGGKGKDEDLERRFKEAQISKLLADANDKKEPVANLSPGEKDVDKAFAKDYEDYTSGGQGRLEKNLGLLRDAKQRLQDEAALEEEGGMSSVSGNVLGRLPDSFRSEKARTLQSDVRQSAQGSLKDSLGAQFTEKEGERIMNSAYDPSLSPKENLVKTNRAFEEIATTAGNRIEKIKYYEKNGTLKGFKSNDGSNYGKDVMDYASKHGISPAEARLIKLQRGG